MTQEWALWAQDVDDDDWVLMDVGLGQEAALLLAKNRSAIASGLGTGTVFSAMPTAAGPPPILERDPQITLGARPCLALGGACRLDAGHEGEHQP
jgi:hypothetical protein